MGFGIITLLVQDRFHPFGNFINCVQNDAMWAWIYGFSKNSPWWPAVSQQI
jgi:hypothetical protein